jgi:hypothetical protein
VISLELCLDTLLLIHVQVLGVNILKLPHDSIIIDTLVLLNEGSALPKQLLSPLKSRKLIGDDHLVLSDASRLLFNLGFDRCDGHLPLQR